MSSRSDHIQSAENLLKEWEDVSDMSHDEAVQTLMAAQAHATLAEAMRVV